MNHQKATFRSSTIIAMQAFSSIPNLASNFESILFSRLFKSSLVAAHKFWVGLKDKPEKQHPRNQDVIDWLSNKEFDPTTAKRMASFIRPEWAKKGSPKKQ